MAKLFEVRPHHAEAGQVVDEASVERMRLAFGPRTFARHYALRELPTEAPAPLATVAPAPPYAPAPAPPESEPTTD